MAVAEAYEADIHYSTTYVLARAVGWSQADALTIASANQGVDENSDTVAALEVDATPRPSFAGYVASSLRQARQNLRFHCFSKTRGQAGQISADVREVISRNFAEVPDHDEDPRRNASRLIALGVALHCQQDAYSHAGFGGSCGSSPGSCYGHTHQTFFDQVAFALLGKHYFNPDHPGVSGQRLLEVLQATVSELAARRSKASLRSSSSALVSLSDALRKSGLQLPDEVRRECNRHIAGKWLFDFFHAGGRMRYSRETLEKLAPEVAVTCKNAALASATIVRIPEARFPRLNPDASPYPVQADGTYQRIRGGEFEAISGLVPNYNTRKVKVQLSHWSQLLALPLTRQVALSPAINAPRQGESDHRPGASRSVVQGLLAQPRAGDHLIELGGDRVEGLIRDALELHRIQLLADDAHHTPAPLRDDNAGRVVVAQLDAGAAQEIDRFD
jgi:hypothetical protein